MPSPGHGMLPFSQTGPVADLDGQPWDGSPVEGAQNFADFQDQGAGDAFSPFGLGQATPTRGEEGLEDFHSQWHMPAASEVPTMSVSVSQPMRRTTSGSSAGSHKSGPSASSRSRRRLQDTLAQAQQLSYEHMTAGNVSQYLELDPMQVPHQGLYPGMATGPYSPESLACGLPGVTQHVDPTCTQVQLEFEPSLAGYSPTQTWDSYSSALGRTPSPEVFDEPLQLHASSPTDTSTSSPEFRGQSPRISRRYSGPQHQLAPADDRLFAHGLSEDFALPPAHGAPRMSTSDGEFSARDHPLYKQVSPHPDGLFHCPWEGQEGCNHKPEKLKCNYDKFVDSHLKPYRCKLDSCENAKFSSTACLLRHEREAHGMHGHGEKPYMCTYAGCERSAPGNGFPRHWNLKDHMKRVHNDVAPAQPQAVSPPPSGPSRSRSSSSSSGSSSKSRSEAKSRKRKQELAPESSSSSRKASSPKTQSPIQSQAPVQVQVQVQASMPTIVEEPPRMPEQYEEWQDHHQQFSSLVPLFSTSPWDPNMVQYISDAQDHLNAMSRISTDLRSKKAHRHHHHGQRQPSRGGDYRQSYLVAKG